eukprot:gene8422-9322_t
MPAFNVVFFTLIFVELTIGNIECIRETTGAGGDDRGAHLCDETGPFFWHYRNKHILAILHFNANILRQQKLDANGATISV